MTKAPQGKLVTKKHQARVERERTQTRMLLIGSAVALVLVVLLLAYGVIDQTLIQPNRAVAKVNGESIPIKEYTAAVQFNYANAIDNYLYMSQFFGQDESYKNQVQSQLNSTGLTTLDALIEDRLIREEARRRGITVSQEEVDRIFQQSQRYFPNGTPTPEPTLEPIATSTLSSFQMTAVAPTATAMPAATTVPTTTAAMTPTTDINETAVITESAATPAITETASITPTAVPTPQPTATPYTEQLYQDNLKATYANYAEQGVPKEQLRRIIESNLYREKVQEAIVAEMSVERTEEQVWARHILVYAPITDTLTITGTVPATATLPISITTVLAQLEDGADFATLAAQYSQDVSNASNGGDLGWFGKGKMDPAFEEAAWNLEVGDYTLIPIKSSFGYHIIQVLGHEQRPLSDSEYEQLQQTRFQEWLDQQRAAAKVETFDDVWLSNIPKAPDLDIILSNLQQPQ